MGVKILAMEVIENIEDNYFLTVWIYVRKPAESAIIKSVEKCSLTALRGRRSKK